MLRGLATVNFFADDLIAARDWYADLFGIDAYFQRPDAQTPPNRIPRGRLPGRAGHHRPPLRAAPRRGTGRCGVYRHVDDVEAR